MADPSIAAQSRKIVGIFLKRQQRQFEALRNDLGTELVDKLDTISKRDLVRQDRDASLAKLTDSEPPEERTFKVVVNLRIARTSPDRLSATRSVRARRRVVRVKRRSGELALQRLQATCKEAGATVRRTL